MRAHEARPHKHISIDEILHGLVDVGCPVGAHFHLPSRQNLCAGK